MKAHWTAEIFPLNNRDVERIAEDIAANGQREPILVYQGEILDGRTRFAACKKLGIEPILKEYGPANGTPTDEELLALSWSLNECRRHLTTSQRACAAAEVIERFPEEAKKPGPRPKGNSPDNRITPTLDRFKVGDDTVRHARELLREAPDAFARVKAGKETVAAAHSSILILRKAAKVEAQRNSLAALREKSPDLAERVEAGTINREQAEAELEKREKERRSREILVNEFTSDVFVAFSAIHIVEEKMMNAGVTVDEVIAARKPHQRKDDIQRYREVNTLVTQLEKRNLEL